MLMRGKELDRRVLRMMTISFAEYVGWRRCCSAGGTLFEAGWTQV